MSRNAPTIARRQQTLLNAIAWSHDLLNPEAGRMLTILGAFAASARLDDLEAVADHGLDVAEALTTLIDFSLLRRLVTAM